MIKQVSGATVVTLSGLLLTTGLGVVLARLLGPEDYGFYSYIVSIATLISLPLFAGLPTLVVREVSALLGKNQTRSLKAFSTFVFLLLFFSGLTLILLLLCAEETYPTIFAGFGVLVVCHIAVLNLEQILSAFLRGSGNVVWALIPKNILRPAILILACYGVSDLDSELSSSTVLSLNVLAWLFVCVCLTVRFKIVKPELFSAMRPTKLQCRVWGASLLPLTLYGGMSMANSEVITVLLGTFSHPSEVGVYKVAMAVTALAGLGLGVINTVMAPRFSRAFSLGDDAEIYRLIVSGGLLALLSAITVAIVVLWLGSELISVIFGPDYETAITLVYVALFGQLINVAAGSPALLLNMAGKERMTARGMFIALVITVMLSFLLIPEFGGIGATIAFTVSILSWNFILAVLVYRELGLHSSPIMAKWLCR